MAEYHPINARLHTVTHPQGHFGYPAVKKLSGSTWPEAFTTMIGAWPET